MIFFGNANVEHIVSYKSGKRKGMGSPNRPKKGVNDTRDHLDAVSKNLGSFSKLSSFELPKT
jgi:hypothetical protein